MMTPNRGVRPPAERSLTQYTGYLLRGAHAKAAAIAGSALPPGRNPRQFAVLTILVERGPTSQQQLADLLHVNRTLMVTLVDILEQDGLLTRERDPQDRRAYALTLTTDGRQAVRTLRPSIIKGDSRLTKSLTSAEKTMLDQHLRRLLPHPGLATIKDLGSCSAFLITRVYQHLLSLGRNAMRELGIEPRHFGTMFALAQIEPCSQQQLAEKLGVTQPVVLDTLADLERQALINRTRSTTDRRAYQLTLAEDGRSHLHNAQQQLDTIQAGIASALGTAGDVELRRLLTQIITDTTQ